MGRKPYENLHIYKYLWSKCNQKHIIIKAWKKLRKGKTKRKAVQKIEANFDYYVEFMSEMLKNTRPDGDESKAFNPAKLYPKYIKEYGKVREIYRPPIIDQWVHHIIIIVLSPIIMRFSYKFSCGSMPKRGNLYGKRQLERIIKKKGGFKYFAKLDVRHFYNSIKLNVVIKELKVFIDDDWFIYLIKVVFRDFKNKLPLGFYISQWLANFVLSRIDFKILNMKPICYIRFADDFVICDNNKKKLHKIVIKIKRSLGKLRLKLKNNYQVIRFDYTKENGKRIGRCIDFMGYKFNRNTITLRKKILKRITGKARKLHSLTVIARSQANGFLSLLGWIKYTDVKSLFSDYIQKLVSIKSLKQIVRKYQRRINNENKLDARDSRLLSAAI